MAIDNSLLGKYDKEDSNVQRAVYRVKNANDNNYTRVHFETSSQMIHDATSEASAFKVARRDSTGSIQFKNIEALQLIKGNSLEVASTSSLNGVTTIGGGLTNGTTALVVTANKNTSLGGALNVAGTSSFADKTTHSNGSEIKNGATVTSGGLTVTAGGAKISGDLVVTAGSNVIANSNLTTNGNTILGSDNTKTTTINGTAKINKLEVTDIGVVKNLNADMVDSCNVNDAIVPDTSTLWTAKKIDDTKANKSIRINASNRLVIEGNNTLGGDITIKHTTGRPVGTVATTTSFTVLKSMVFDDYGHPTSYVETDLDARYPRKTISINAGTGLTGGGSLEDNRTINHADVQRTSTVIKDFGTSGTTCPVIKSVTSNQQGHVTVTEEVDLDKRYYTKDLTNQEIENRINNVVGNDVILKNPLSGTVNGPNLKMEGFTMQFNKTANAIEFVFV